MVKVLLASGVLMASVVASAALPPEWDQASKFKTILSDESVVSGLGAGTIKAITQTEANVFAVEFDKYRCTYLVTLMTVPIDRIGPVKYQVRDISQPTCERP